MTDRELLELAAKAAGVHWDDRNHQAIVSAPLETFSGWRIWNPLTDDGDALRLAVKLQIDVAFVGHHAPGRVVVFSDGNWSEFCDPDPYAATRRAIVRAAAEMARLEATLPKAETRRAG